MTMPVGIDKDYILKSKSTKLADLLYVLLVDKSIPS